MLGQLFNWYEKGNSNVVPIKVETSPDKLPPLQDHAIRYMTPRRAAQPLASQANLRTAAATSAKKLQLADSRQRNASHKPLLRESLSARNKPINNQRGRNQTYGRGGAGTLTNDTSHETGV